MTSGVDRWAKLPPEVRARLEARLRGEHGSASGDGSVIPSRADHDRAPLSYSQERLWFLDRLNPGDISLNRPWALRLTGPLQVRALEAGINQILLRHEALRTRFLSEEGVPFQRVQAYRRLTIPRTGLAHRPETERIHRAEQLAQAAVRQPFDLTRDILIRPQLIQLSRTDSILLLTTHHIGFDGWSEKLFLTELAALYESHAQRRPASLPNLGVQYCDYAYWQRQTLRGAELERLIRFWSAELAGYRAEFPGRSTSDLSPGGVGSGSAVSVKLPERLGQDLRTVAREGDATLFMALLTGFYLVLSERLGASDLAVGTLVASRTVPQIESLIGFFVNTLVLRCHLDPQMSFLDLLRKVREKTILALAHQQLPYARLVQELRPARQLGYPVLVDHVFQLRNFPEADISWPGLEVERFAFDPGLAIHDLSLSVEELENTLQCTANYRTGVFRADEMDQLLQRYGTVLAEAAADPSRPIGELASLHPPRISLRDPSGDQPAPQQTRLERSNLTRSQLLIWAGEKLRPSTALYSIPYAFRIHGRLDERLFRQSFRELVGRCDALQTVLIEQDGVPSLQVQQSGQADLPLVDLSSDAQAEQAATDWIAARARSPLPLASTLYEAALLKIASDEWIWYLNMHHMIADARAVEIIFREMQALYGRAAAGEQAPARQLPSFQAYLEADRERRASADFARSQRYWQEKLNRPPDPLHFYGRDSSPAELAVHRLVEDLGPHRSQRLREWARGALSTAKTEDASLLNAFAAVMAAYMRRTAGAKYVSIAMPYHNRASEIERRTIGSLMEVSILRLEVEPGDTFSSLAAKAAQEAIQSLAHRGFTPANPEHGKAYAVTLNLHTTRYAEFAGMPVETTWVHTGLDEDLLSLRIHDYEGAGSLKCDFEFNQEIFPPEQARRAVRHFVALLDALLEDPFQEIGSVDILTGGEWSLVAGLNATSAQPPAEHAMVEVLEHQARSAPDLTAVVESQTDRSTSYQQIEDWSNALAGQILAEGIGREELVGVLGEHTAATVASLWAIWKAGAAYLPLDPGHPEPRLARLLADSGARLVLGAPEALARLHSSAVKALPVDRNPAAGLPADRGPRPGGAPGDLAYMIYTSGSTGQPKGVLVEHGSLANFATWARRAFGLGPRDRVLQFAAMIWDTSLEEIVPALASGATLVFRSEAMLSSYPQFLMECERMAITVLTLPTAYWHGLCDFLSSEDWGLPSSVRLVNVGGERLARARLEQWFRQVRGDVRLVNTYGLTESTAVALMAELNHERGMPAGAAVPIGRPIRNMRAYVLDEALLPVPVGSRGELYLAGAGLARGYRGDPGLTSRLFVNASFRSGTQEQLLKTGDQVELRADGQLVSVGRMDRQVKVRGHRLQPGEVEDWLLRHPKVRQAVVTVLAENGGRAEAGSGLVAYVVPRSGDKASFPLNELRRQMGQELPDYMVPSAFVLVEDLPLLPGGKVDLQDLPSPQPGERLPPSGYRPPRDELERKLVQAWEKALNIRPIGILDNFFDLGGHSLLAIQLFSHMEKLTGHQLPIRAIFEAPTIEGIAARIRGGADVHGDSPVIPLQPNGKQPPIFWVHAAGGLALSYARLAALLGPDQPSYAIQAREIDGALEPIESVDEMAAYYVAEIKRVQPSGPYLLGGLSFGGLVAWEMARQLLAVGDEVPYLGLLDTRGPDFPTALIDEDAAYDLRQRLDFHRGNLSALNWRGRVSYLASRGRVAADRLWRRLASAMLDLEPRQAGGLRGASRRSLWAARLARSRYEPGPYPGRVVLFRAKQQPGGYDDPLLGWGRMATGGIEVREVPGAHVSIMAAPRIKVLAKEIKLSLERSSSVSTSDASPDDPRVTA